MPWIKSPVPHFKKEKERGKEKRNKRILSYCKTLKVKGSNEMSKRCRGPFLLGVNELKDKKKVVDS